MFLCMLLAMALVLSQAVGTLAKDGSPTGARKIVVFKSAVDVASKDRALSRAGATSIKHLPSVNAVAVYVTSGSQEALAQLPEVAYVVDDAPVYIDGKPQGAPVERLPWGVDRIDADVAWGTVRGQGVKVAVMDTGIDFDHPDLATNVKGGFNATHRSKSADDDNGHGTHVAGIIAALDNSIGVIGVAPEASLYAVKVLDRRGSGYVSDIIEGLDWCRANGIQVVNMSFGLSTDVDLFHQAIIAAHDAGMILVSAAGNSGQTTDPGVQYPGKYPEVIAVSATDSNDAIISVSSTGPEVALAAPGMDIPSTYANGTYVVMYGTSMAAPHVTGTVALALASGISRSQVLDRLTRVATDLGESGQDSSYGFGLVNAGAAVRP